MKQLTKDMIDNGKQFYIVDKYGFRKLATKVNPSIYEVIQYPNKKILYKFEDLIDYTLEEK